MKVRPREQMWCVMKLVGSKNKDDTIDWFPSTIWDRDGVTRMDGTYGVCVY